MFRPRHIVAWGERLKQKRMERYLTIAKELPSEERCARYLARVGEIYPYNVAASTDFWREDLDEECENCPHYSSCELYIGEDQ